MDKPKFTTTPPTVLYLLYCPECGYTCICNRKQSPLILCPKCGRCALSIKDQVVES